MIIRRSHFAVDTDGNLASGQSNNTGTAVNNIIPPYEYLDANYVVRTTTGRNWDTAGQALWNNGCNPVPPPVCPPGTIGVPPICVTPPPPPPPPIFECPVGSTGVFPICFPIVPPPAVDVCLNLEGVQTAVPSGYVQNGSNCDLIVTPPPTDVCPNIPGAQAVVPAGLIIDDSMNCVEETPVLLCKSLIQNGSFEEPVADLNAHDAGFWEPFATIPYWSSTGGFEIWKNMFGGASHGV